MEETYETMGVETGAGTQDDAPKKAKKKTAAKSAAVETEAAATPGAAYPAGAVYSAGAVSSAGIASTAGTVSTAGTASPAGIVKILYIDTVMQGNQIPIGHGAMITGSGRIFTKTIEEFEGEFMTRFVQSLIRARKFIILSGLTDEQREMYGCKYSDGEVLQNAGLFSYLLNCDTAKAVEIYSALCKEHREMVCTYLISRREAGDGRVTVELLRALDDISRSDYADGKSPLNRLLSE